MINTAEMLKVFQRHRGDALVIPGRGGRHWVQISTQPSLDAPLGDPAMGGHASFALGLALAQPRRKVVVFDSEGDLQMGLGALATIAELQPKNLYHFLLDNECYGTTGGQPVPNAKNIRYADMARAAGYPAAHSFEDLETFAGKLESILSQPGPVFIAMKVHPEVTNVPISERRPWQTRRPLEALKDMQKELGVAG